MQTIIKFDGIFMYSNNFFNKIYIKMSKDSVVKYYQNDKKDYKTSYQKILKSL